MPVFSDQSGAGVEVIRTRPRKAEMPEGVRRRLGRDCAIRALRGQGWPLAAIAEVFRLTPRHVRNRLQVLERLIGHDDAET